jgi:uncharacterized protein YegP (UPF0339 family)
MRTGDTDPDEMGPRPGSARAPACFELWYSDTGGYRFQLRVASAGVVICGGFHAARSSALLAIEAIRRNCTREDRYRRLSAGGRTSRFELLASDAEPVARSPLYDSDRALEDALSSVKRWAVIADLRELG